jgi:hypothetical protein
MRPIPASEQPEEPQNKLGGPVSQFPWRSCTQRLAQNQAEVERTDMNQQTLQDVLVPAQGASTHSTGFVAVGKTSFH